MLTDRTDGQPCPLSPVYQAVHNVAAALKLSEPDGTAALGLIYDANNPNFSAVSGPAGRSSCATRLALRSVCGYGSALLAGAHATACPPQHDPHSGARETWLT